MRWLHATTLITGALLLASCQGRQTPPTTPETPSAPPVPVANVAVEPGSAATGLWGVFTLDLNLAEGTAGLTPVAPVRTANAIGDQLAPDITPYLQESPCRECLQVMGLSFGPNGEVAVDIGLSHPFPTTAVRSDLSGFDTRAIIIMPGTTSFPLSPRIHTDGSGTPNLTVLGNFEWLANADGYTSHFDNKPADPAYFNPPLAIVGSVNPYRRFFTEDNPDPAVVGNPIANHRFSQSPTRDIQRFLFALPNDGTTQLQFILVMETQYGVSAMRNIPAGQPGSRQNPVYFLPAFNQPEAYRAEVEVTGTFTAGLTGQFVQVAVEVEDWQAGMLGSVAYGDLGQPGLIPATSDVALVTAEVPGVQAALSSKTVPDSGSGVLGDPYVYSFALQNTAAAPEGSYTGLISVKDSLDGVGGRLTATPGEAVYSFITYKPFTVTVEPNTSGNTPPVAVGSASPNPANSGQTVNFTDGGSYDPDAGDSITQYAWDYDFTGTFVADATFAVSNQGSTTYTNTSPTAIVKTAALRVTDMGMLIDQTTVDITVNGTAPSTCNATAPPAPGNFAAPNFPTPPYNGTGAQNRITFSWNAVPADPCVLGYAIWRTDAKNGGANVLINDLNADNIIQTGEVITGTSFADATLSGSGFKTSVVHYYYRIVTVKDNGSGGLVTSPFATAPKVYVFFDDFENRTTFFGSGTYSRTTSGFSGGLVNNLAFPGGTAFNNYGWNIAQNGPQGAGHNGSSRFLDESAYSANVPPIWGPLNHDPYEYAEDATTAPDGYWNALGPNIWIAGDVNPLAGTAINRMQIFHRYQMQTTAGGADEVCYATCLPDANWLAGVNQFHAYRPLSYISGKNYDGTTPQYPDFLNQAWRPPGNPPNAQQQIPAMQFFAGDFNTPAYGLPNWGPTVFGLTQAAAMTKPIIMFAHTGNPVTQPIQTFGWQIDDICIIAY